MKVLFLGETYRADAITWLKGLRYFDNSEIQTFELYPEGVKTNKISRILQWFKGISQVKRMVKEFNPDIVLAERATSYGFLAALSSHKCIVVAQQGITDVYPEHSLLSPFKTVLAWYAYQKATIIHAWGNVMVPAMLKLKADPNKILVLPKGIDIKSFTFDINSKKLDTINAIITRSLSPEYRHATILKAFAILKTNGIHFKLHIVGNGKLKNELSQLAEELNIKEDVIFHGRISYEKLPDLLKESNIYISMPITEGVSASLLEAMASGCYPIVTDLPANRDWIQEGVNGNLICVDDFEGLAKSIIHLLQNEVRFKETLIYNRKLVEERADFYKNMSFIVKKYNEKILK